MPTGPRPAPPAGTARVAISGKYQGHTFVWVFYLELTGTGIIVNDLATLATDIDTALNTNLIPVLGTDVLFSSIDIRYINSVGSEERYTKSISRTGSLAGTSIQDASACHVISWVISDYYRGGHPRTYLPGLTEALVTNGSDIDASHMATIVNDMNNFRLALNAVTTTNITGVAMGTVRFAQGNAWLSPPKFVQFTSVKAGKNSKVGSQRRRILA